MENIPSADDLDKAIAEEEFREKNMYLLRKKIEAAAKDVVIPNFAAPIKTARDNKARCADHSPPLPEEAEYIKKKFTKGNQTTITRTLNKIRRRLNESLLSDMKVRRFIDKLRSIDDPKFYERRLKQQCRHSRKQKPTREDRRNYFKRKIWQRKKGLY